MTKEQFLNKYFSNTALFMPELEAVIANEIAKAQEAQLQELKRNCSTFDGSRLVDQEQPELNPIAEAYEQGLKIRQKKWLKDAWIQKLSETESTSDTLTTFSNNWDFATHPEKWELYHKSTEQPAKPFDKDRFEAMFRAVVASGRTERWEQDFKFTEEALAKLDAYYATKEGGSNE